MKKQDYGKTLIASNEAYYAESIEQKMRKVIAGADTVTEGSEIIFTDKKDGVLPQYDIRTDRFDIALDAMDKGHRSTIARRENEAKQAEAKDEQKQIDTPVA